MGPEARSVRARIERRVKARVAAVLLARDDRRLTPDLEEAIVRAVREVLDGERADADARTRAKR